MPYTRSQVEYKLRVLPKLIEQSIQAGTKTHAQAFMKVLVDGLRKGNLVSPKLSSLTLKIRKNMKDNSIPESPLVGHGRMIENLEVVKKKNVWVCKPNNKFAVSRYSTKKTRISYEKLWLIHEFGTKQYTTTPKQRWFFENIFRVKPAPGKLQIPARYPWKKALNRYIRQQYRKETNKQIIEKMKGMLLK